MINTSPLTTPKLESTPPSHHVVFGAGPLGRATARALARHGAWVTLAHRGRQPQPAFEPALQARIRIVQADARDAQQVRKLLQGDIRTQHASDTALPWPAASSVHLCAATEYSAQAWLRDLKPLQETVARVAGESGVLTVLGDNLYMYGTPDAPLTESSPMRPSTGKGQARAQIAKDLLAMQAQGLARVAFVRGADFFGTEVNNAALGDRVFAPMLRGKAAQLVGALDQPRSMTYIDDFGETMARVALLDRLHPGGLQATGVWHVPSATLTQRQWLTLIGQHTGQPVRITVLSRWMLAIVGLFVPPARELIEMLPSFERPYVVDAKRTRDQLGFDGTPAEQAIAASVAGWRQRLAAQG